MAMGVRSQIAKYSVLERKLSVGAQKMAAEYGHRMQLLLISL
jgi:hypothetical protein